MDLKKRLKALVAKWRDLTKHDKLDDPIYEVCAEELEAELAAESSLPTQAAQSVEKAATAPQKLHIALHFDPEEHGWPRIAGIYSTSEAAMARIVELKAGGVQSVELNQPVKFTFEAAAAAVAVKGREGT